MRATGSAVEACSLPGPALLARYASAGGYTDCYRAEVAGSVSLAAFVTSFYTGGLFRIERFVLSALLSRPSTDAQARQLAAGEIAEFSAWRVEARTADQLLMRPIDSRTRSWLMVAPAGPAEAPTTLLYFGSAVVPIVDRSTGQTRASWLFTALLGFHQHYSRLLLGSARARLARPGSH